MVLINVVRLKCFRPFSYFFSASALELYFIRAARNLEAFAHRSSCVALLQRCAPKLAAVVLMDTVRPQFNRCCRFFFTADRL